MRRYLSFDISAYQERPPTIWFEYMKSIGCRLAIIQLWGGTPWGTGPNPFASYQLGQSLEAGLEVAGYSWICPDNSIDTAGLIAASFSAAGSLVPHLKFVAPDLEGARIHPYAPTTRLLNALKNIAERWPRAQEQPLYCRANNWDMAVGGSSFSKNPLWEAQYLFPSGRAPHSSSWDDRWLDWNWHPFGGWRQRAAIQFAGTVDIESVGADLNIVDYDRLGIPEDKEESMPLSNEDKEWIKEAVRSEVRQGHQVTRQASLIATPDGKVWEVVLNMRRHVMDKEDFEGQRLDWANLRRMTFEEAATIPVYDELLAEIVRQEMEKIVKVDITVKGAPVP